jgi:hypothetical protein
MEVLTKSCIGMLLVMVAVSTALLAQSHGPDTLQNHPNLLDARQIVGRSVRGHRAQLASAGPVHLHGT